MDTDKHDSMFELEAVERSLDSLERAMETKKHWHLQGREHLQHMLKATRKTEEAFHEEIDDGSFRTARFSGKVRGFLLWNCVGKAGSSRTVFALRRSGECFFLYILSSTCSKR